ncbi:hypothetical protein FB451DRAFT_1415909 [Mycena latifolia]|nr:hypothetical protein FB451DRAFT_1415909 [Mycena latifolia]
MVVRRPGVDRLLLIRGSLGSSVTLFGTVVARNPPDVSLGFLIDNAITRTYAPPADRPANIHHQALWASPPLTDGSHTLVITQTTAQVAGVIFLDYLMWNTTSTAVSRYVIDDRDARVKYTPPWQEFGSDDDFMHTSQATTAAGDALALHLKGTAVSFYGGINNGSAGEVLSASMVVDGGPPVFFVPGPQPSALSTNNLLFSSADLEAGAHTVVVTAENAHTVWADYFLVTPNPTASDAAPTTTASKTHTHTAVGYAAAGGIILLLALLAAAWFLRQHWRRRQRQQQRQTLDRLPLVEPEGLALEMTPFLVLATDVPGSGGQLDAPRRCPRKCQAAAPASWTTTPQPVLPSGKRAPQQAAGQGTEEPPRDQE